MNAPPRLGYRVAVITLYDNAFGPFARKVRMVLEHKGLAFESVDGLAPAWRKT
jgi:hypothetical protein